MAIEAEHCVFSEIAERDLEERFRAQFG